MANCRTCALPGAQLALVADLHRRNVPLRTIAAELATAGHPVNKDSIWRHCRDHLAPADLYGPSHEPDDNAAGLTVATVFASQLSGWPSKAAECAAALRAEGLYGPADVLSATIPETMQAGLLAAKGTPACELLQARLLDQAVQLVVRGGSSELAAALNAALRSLGGDDIADALDVFLDKVSV